MAAVRAVAKAASGRATVCDECEARPRDCRPATTPAARGVRRQCPEAGNLLPEIGLKPICNLCISINSSM